MDNKSHTHEFTLVLDRVNDKTEKLEDHLFEAGCDDALINFRSGTVYLDFNRDALSFENAVISAIQEVESSPLGAKVISILPDDFVSESEIAKRLGRSRQTVSLWVKRERREFFPNPISKLSDKSPLWRWHDVVKWLHDQNLIKDEQLLESALFLGNINAILSERDPEIREYRHRILDKLEDFSPLHRRDNYEANHAR